MTFKIVVFLLFLVALFLALPQGALALSMPAAPPEVNHQEVQVLTTWLAAHGCPNDAVYFVESASANNLDYRTLVPIWIIESGCGRHQLHNNGLGFEPAGSLQGFPSTAAAIAYVSRQLAYGRPYAGKTLKQKIYVYNSVGEPHYYAEYLNLFNSIKE